MAIPTGNGTEVLHRGTIAAQDDDTTSFRFDGQPAKGTDTYAVPTDTIITIINITFCNMQTSSQELNLWLAGGVGADTQILKKGTLPGNGTFVYSDKIILHPTDKIKVNIEASSTDVDIHYGYIKQDWDAS